MDDDLGGSGPGSAHFAMLKFVPGYSGHGRIVDGCPFIPAVNPGDARRRRR